MKRVSRIAVFALAMAAVLGLTTVIPGLQFPVVPQTVVKAAGEDLAYDVACDCRTFVFGPNRGDPFIVNGKIFPAGTLPVGAASNDPTLPVNGVAPIGTWTCRGQNAAPFPEAVASAYNSSPFSYFDWHFFLAGGRGLNATGYPTSPTGETSSLSVTGTIGDFGIGALRSAIGEIRGAQFGINGTGCPNFRANIVLRPSL